MLRRVFIGFAAVALVGATLVPDEALARGYHGGGARYAGRAHVSQPIAGRGVAYRGGVYRGAAYRGTAYRRGYYPYARAAVGAAAVGAAAAGAYGYYNNYNSGCYYDTYGNWTCPYR